MAKLVRRHTSNVEIISSTLVGSIYFLFLGPSLFITHWPSPRPCPWPYSSTNYTVTLLQVLHLHLHLYISTSIYPPLPCPTSPYEPLVHHLLVHVRPTHRNVVLSRTHQQLPEILVVRLVDRHLRPQLKPLSTQRTQPLRCLRA